jgi:hypothetical protein
MKASHILFLVAWHLLLALNCCWLYSLSVRVKEISILEVSGTQAIYQFNKAVTLQQDQINLIVGQINDVFAELEKNDYKFNLKQESPTRIDLLIFVLFCVMAVYTFHVLSVE